MAATMAAADTEILTREDAVRAFLLACGWQDAVRAPIPGDASFRRYERLRKGNESAILMDAPPERENTNSFVNAQRYLQHAGYSAPRILHALPEEGLLLLEDYGNDSVSLHLRQTPEHEAPIYRDAVALLAKMAQQGLSQVESSGSRFAPYSPELLEQEAMLLAQWLLPEILPVAEVVEAVEAYAAVWRDMLAQSDVAPQVVTHRDYHADNLFLLSDHKGIARIGLLDFQDAVLGRPAYDLVSLLEDARRDVAPKVVADNLRFFSEETGMPQETLLREYAFYGAQRNAKILGIFTRLYRRDGKPRYLAMLPRVWNYFEGNLRHPSMAPLLAWRQRYISSAVEARLLNLKYELTGEA
jgi:aminoglycoside/choline kinase family phosphotransferase